MIISKKITSKSYHIVPGFFSSKNDLNLIKKGIIESSEVQHRKQLTEQSVSQTQSEFLMVSRKLSVTFCIENSSILHWVKKFSISLRVCSDVSKRFLFLCASFQTCQFVFSRLSTRVNNFCIPLRVFLDVSKKVLFIYASV